MNIIFLCTGNTCRSAMAEGLFKKIVSGDTILSKKVDKISSAGFMALNGGKASDNAISVCRELNVDISKHSSASVNESMLNENDLFVCMTNAHAEMLMSMGVSKEKIYILNISDPFGGKVDVYRNCCKEIYENLIQLAEKIKKS